MALRAAKMTTGLPGSEGEIDPSSLLLQPANKKTAGMDAQKRENWPST
jgi:hypothetical protein